MTQERKLRETMRKIAQLQWDNKFSDKDKAVVRFGMIPLWAWEEVERIYVEQIKVRLGSLATGKVKLPADLGRNHSLALMECAEADGGMVA